MQLNEMALFHQQAFVAGKWCDAGFDMKGNVCRAKLDKGEKCGKLGSFGNDHKCQSGECSGAPKYECK